MYTIYKQVDNIDNKLNNNENNKVDQFNQNTQHPFSSTTSPIFKPIITKINFSENEILKPIASRLDKLEKNKGINIIDENDNKSIQTSSQSENDNKKIN